MCRAYSPDYNNSGTNGGAGASNSPSGGGGGSDGPPTSPGPGSSQASYGSYYQIDGGYTAPSATKSAKKKPMNKGGKAAFTSLLGANSGTTGGYQCSNPPGQGSYNQFGQGYGQGKKTFSQNQGGAGAYSYSTAYPSQVTGGAGGSQDYSYEGELVLIIFTFSVSCNSEKIFFEQDPFHVKLYFIVTTFSSPLPVVYNDASFIKRSFSPTSHQKYN